MYIIWKAVLMIDGLEDKMEYTFYSVTYELTYMTTRLVCFLLL